MAAQVGWNRKGRQYTRPLIQTALEVLVALMIMASLAPAAGAYTEKEEQGLRSARMRSIRLGPGYRCQVYVLERQAASCPTFEKQKKKEGIL